MFKTSFNLLIIYLLNLFIILLLTKNVLAESLDIKTPAKHVLIYDHKTNNVIYEKNSFELMKPASMAKVMTAYIVFDRIKDGTINLNDKFQVSHKAWKKGGSKTFLELNTQVNVKDLLMGLIVQSGNDAAIVLAEGISGNEEAFAREMNQYAKLLGMKNTYFTNSTGWPHPDLKTTSNDLMILTKNIIINFPEMYNFFKIKSFKYNNIKQPNRNPLIYGFSGSDGLKTGYTLESGYGLIGSAVRKKRRISIVINGLKGKTQRAFEGKRLLNIAFRETKLLSLFNKKRSLAKANVWLGTLPSVDLVARKELNILISPLELKKASIKIEWSDPIPAPIIKGAKLGIVKIILPGRNLIQTDLISVNSISKQSSLMQFKTLLKFLLYGDLVAE